MIGGRLRCSTAGDAFGARVDTPREAVAAAVRAQRAVQGEVWPDMAVVRVRMGVHVGDGAGA